MVKLFVNKNIVTLKKTTPDAQRFIKIYLTKYEDIVVPDLYNSTKNRRVFKTIKELRELYTESQDKDFIYFSRGLLTLIPESEYEIRYTTKDQMRIPEIDKDTLCNLTLPYFKLREDQVVAVMKSLLFKRGIIQLPTATGKSAIISSVLKSIKTANPQMKALILAPTLSTVDNINDTLIKFGLDSEKFGSSNKSITKECTTSIIKSLITQSQKNPNLLKEINTVIYDECFPSTAKVLTTEGYLSIGEIYNRSDINEVITYSTQSRQYEVHRILSKFKTPHNQRYSRVYYRNPITLKKEGVTATPYHKFWTKNRGYVMMKDLIPEDLLKIDIPEIRATCVDPYAQVISIRHNVGKLSEFRYNLEIDETHNYFVDHILVSNCHHLKCDTWKSLNSLLPNVEYSLGFSALCIDPKEMYYRDIRQVSYDTSLIIGSTGPVLMHMNPSYYIERGIIARPVVFRLKNWIDIPQDFDETQYAKLVKLGLMSTPRINQICKVCGIFNKYNRKSLILVAEREQAFMIAEMLSRHELTNFGISFGARQGYTFSKYVNDKVEYKTEDSHEVLCKISSGEISILIGTSHIDEGVDLSGLDTVIFAGSGKKDRRVIQRAGRALRSSKNGKYAYIIDFADNGSRVLSRHSRERLKIYENTIGISKDSIYDIAIEGLEDKFKCLEGLN